MAYITPDGNATDQLCCRVSIPNDPFNIAAFLGAIMDLGYSSNWESIGGLTPSEVSEQWREIFSEIKVDNCMIGTVVAYAAGDWPTNWLLCDGQRYLRADFPKLSPKIAFNLIDPNDNAYFFTPNLIDRFVIGGNTPNKVGNTGGAETVTLTEAQLPVVTVQQDAHGHQAIAHTHTQAGHFHTYQVPSFNLDIEGPGAPDPLGFGQPMLPAATDWKAPEIYPAGGDVNPTTATNQPFGSGEAHDNMPPYYTLRYFMIAG